MNTEDCVYIRVSSESCLCLKLWEGWEGSGCKEGIHPLDLVGNALCPCSHLLAAFLALGAWYLFVLECRKLEGMAVPVFLKVARELLFLWL